MDKCQEGIVLEADGKFAKVKTSRHNDCENCGACPGNSAIVLQAHNILGARPGQKVMVEVKEVHMLKAAFIVYVMPLLAALLGAIAGAVGAGFLGVTGNWPPTVGGVVFFALALLYIKYFDSAARKDQRRQPVITQILD